MSTMIESTLQATTPTHGITKSNTEISEAPNAKPSADFDLNEFLFEDNGSNELDSRNYNVGSGPDPDFNIDAIFNPGTQADGKDPVTYSNNEDFSFIGDFSNVDFTTYDPALWEAVPSPLTALPPLEEVPNNTAPAEELPLTVTIQPQPAGCVESNAITLPTPVDALPESLDVTLPAGTVNDKEPQSAAVYKLSTPEYHDLIQTFPIDDFSTAVYTQDPTKFLNSPSTALPAEDFLATLCTGNTPNWTGSPCGAVQGNVSLFPAAQYTLTSGNDAPIAAGDDLEFDWDPLKGVDADPTVTGAIDYSFDFPQDGNVPYLNTQPAEYPVSVGDLHYPLAAPEAYVSATAMKNPGYPVNAFPLYTASKKIKKEPSTTVSGEDAGYDFLIQLGHLEMVPQEYLLWRHSNLVSNQAQLKCEARGPQTRTASARLVKPAKLTSTRIAKKRDDWANDAKGVYPSHPQPPSSWGPLSGPRGTPLFQYTKDGELRGGKTFTTAELHHYIEHCPRELVIWVQNFPAQSKGRIGPEGSKCRWEGCPLSTRTIQAGWYRVAFDEFSQQTTDGDLDPFIYAGCMHLWCYEQCFDPMVDYCAQRLQGDDRTLDHEDKNPMALNRDTDKGVMHQAFHPWFSEQPVGQMQYEPRPHGESLACRLVEYHLEKQTKTRQAKRDERNSKHRKNEHKTIEVHKGDLYLFSVRSENHRTYAEERGTVLQGPNAFQIRALATDPTQIAPSGLSNGIDDWLLNNGEAATTATYNYAAAVGPVAVVGSSVNKRPRFDDSDDYVGGDRKRQTLINPRRSSRIASTPRQNTLGMS